MFVFMHFVDVIVEMVLCNIIIEIINLFFASSIMKWKHGNIHPSKSLFN